MTILATADPYLLEFIHASVSAVGLGVTLVLALWVYVTARQREWRERRLKVLEEAMENVFEVASLLAIQAGNLFAEIGSPTKREIYDKISTESQAALRIILRLTTLLRLFRFDECRSSINALASCQQHLAALGRREQPLSEEAIDVISEKLARAIPEATAALQEAHFRIEEEYLPSWLLNWMGR